MDNIFKINLKEQHVTPVLCIRYAVSGSGMELTVREHLFCMCEEALGSMFGNQNMKKNNYGILMRLLKLKVKATIHFI